MPPPYTLKCDNCDLQWEQHRELHKVLDAAYNHEKMRKGHGVSVKEKDGTVWAWDEEGWYTYDGN